MKARRIIKEKRIRVWAYLDESQYKELLLYKLACQDEWNVEITMKELVEEMLNGLMDSDFDFNRFKKGNKELVEKIQSGEYEDEPDDEPEPQEPEEPETEDEPEQEPEPEPEQEQLEVREGQPETTMTDGDEERANFHRRWGS